MSGQRYFADTAFWIATSHKSDQFHQRAVRWHRYLQRSGTNIVTTEAVLWEWMNALAGRSTRRIVADGYRFVHHDSRIEVVAWDASLTERAVRLFQDRADKSWSLTDCLSFTVMDERRLQKALTTDHHFSQAGFEALFDADPPSV